MLNGAEIHHSDHRGEDHRNKMRIDNLRIHMKPLQRAKSQLELRFRNCRRSARRASLARSIQKLSARRSDPVGHLQRLRKT